MKRILITYLVLCALVAGAYAYLPASGAGQGGPAGASTTTWNPSDKDTGITLSGGNLVATSSTSLANCTVGAGFCSVRSIASHSTGKYYWEIVVTNLGGAANDENVGLANSTWPLFNTSAGGDTNSAGYRHSTTPSGMSCTSTPDTWGASDLLQLAVDFGAALIWMKVNSGNWNGDATGDPATGVKGCDISIMNAGPYFAAVNGSNDANTVFTANFGGSAYAGTAPSGYGNW